MVTEECEMPTTEEARRDEIAAKAEESTERHSVQWQNDRIELCVINLSLDSVLLNPASHRIRAQIESHPQRIELEGDPFSEPAQEIIEKILAETSGFQALADNLRESGQLEPGIITSMGVLVNGNTRAVALRHIAEDYIRVGVLPSSATEREISELEARLQLARDYKQEYTLTNELLFIKERIDLGTTVEDLAILLGKAQSRNPLHLRRGVSEIEKSLRILQHIREVQLYSDGTIPLTFFDPHESALTEADSAYIKIYANDPAQARHVRDGRIAGVLVGVTYRNLRHWDSDEFLANYVEPQFDGDEVLRTVFEAKQAEEGSGDVEPNDGLDILDQLDESTDPTVDPSKLLVVVAREYGTSDEVSVGEGLTKSQLYDQIEERLTQAAEESAQDVRDEKRRSTPIKLVREARQKLSRARDALRRSSNGVGFDRGKLKYELRRLGNELRLLADVNDAGN